MIDFFKRFNVDYFFAVPAVSKVIYFWLGLYLLVLLLCLVSLFVLRRKGKKNKPYKSFAKKLMWTEVPISILGLFFVFLRYELLQVWSWRFWQYLTFLSLVTATVWLIFQWKKLQKDLVYYNSQKRKEKWLKKKNK